MIKELFQIYKIGKDLNLSKKEINGSLSFKEEAHKFRDRIIYSIILLVLVILTGFVIFLATQIGIIEPITTSGSNTYGADGARYSTIRIKDFKKKFRYYIQIK